MDKKFLAALLVVIAVGLILYTFRSTPSGTLTEQTSPQTAQTVSQTAAQRPFDPMNTTYTINGETVALTQGKAEVPVAPGSASMTTTMIFGTPTSGDLNGDGRPDAAVLLSQDGGGSGTFYYIAAVIDGGVEGTNAILLGDRIAPQTVEISKGRIIVNYAERKPGEPMSAQPSVGVSRYFKYSTTAAVR